VILLSGLTAFLILGCIELIQGLNGKAVYLTVLSIIACVLAVFNLIYNNLLINVRFSFKMGSRFMGFICYDGFNPLVCDCFLRKVCHDQFCSVGTAVKWTFKTAYLAVLIGLIKDWKKKNNIQYIGLLSEDGHSSI
jgi:hypothetical protein